MGSQRAAPQTTHTTQEVKLPEWVNQAGQENYAEAKRIGGQAYEGYDGPRVAGLSALEAAAPGQVAAGQAAANAGFMTAQGAAQGATGFQNGGVTAPTGVADVNAGSFMSRDIGAYMDPNIQNVINPTLDNMRRQGVLEEQRHSDAARGVGAWGGSRHAVGEAVRGAENLRARAATEGALRGQAFESAAGRVGQDIAGANQAALANQQSGLTTQGQRIQAQTADAAAAAQAANIRLQGGALAGTTGVQQGQSANQGAMLQAGFGANERGLNQQALDVNYNNFMAEQQHPQEMLNLRMQALGMTPYGKTTTGTQTTPGQQSSSPWMTGIGAAATFLPMIFSDRKVKKNVKKVGKVEGTDLNKYEFEYKKGFVGGTPGKQVGLMAQDVESKAPGAVKAVKVGGETIKAVNYDKAIRDRRDDKGKKRGMYKPRVQGFMRAA